MKKATLLKRLCMLFLSFAILLVSNFTVVAYGVGFTTASDEAKIVQMIAPVDELILNAAKSLIKNSFLLRSAQYNIGNVFAIYNADIDCIVYNLPVFSCGECVAVIQYSDNMEMSISDGTQVYESVIGLPHDEYILYITGGIIYAQSHNDNIILEDTGYAVSSNEQYLEKSCDEKKNELIERLGNKFDIAEVSFISNSCSCENSLASASPNVVVPNMGYVECDIKDFVKQGNYNLCWAACVATIVNFKKGLSLTAMNVADEMGINYMAGAGAGEMNDALAAYGLNYSLYYGKLSWSTVKSRIHSKKPFIMVVDAGAEKAHAIVAYAYSYFQDDSDVYMNERCISVWDPRDENVSWPYYNTTVFIKGYYFRWDGGAA